MDISLKPYQSYIIIFLLIITTLIVYRQLRNNEFIAYDDNTYITDNTNVQNGLTLDGIVWAFTTGDGANWHPLTWISHMLDYQLYGLNPTGHHLTNLLFHIINSILLFIVLKRMTGALWQSAFIAALFALHPLHVESVAWAAERKDVLSAFFWMSTMGMYSLYVQQSTVRNYLLALLFFVLGLLAKPMLVTLPFVLLLLDYWPLRRFQFQESLNTNTAGVHNGVELNLNKSTWFSLIREKIPFFVLAAISSIVTYIVQQHGGAVRSLDVIPLLYRIANALVAYLQYIVMTFWPSRLALIYPYLVGSLPKWQIALACVVLISVTYLIVRYAKRLPYLVVGWLWYIGTLVPVIGIVQVGSQTLATRYMYVPLIGLSIMIAWGVSELLRGWVHRRIVFTVLAGACLLALSVCSLLQVNIWHDTISVFEHDLQITTNNFIAHSNLAFAFTKQGKIDESIVHYKESLRINPQSAEVHNNFGTALTKQGKIDEAISQYAEAVRINPDLPVAQFNLAFCLAAQGQIQQAVDHYSEAVRAQPEYTDARMNLGTLFAQQGDIPKAIAQFSEIIRFNPRYVRAYYVIGFYLAAEGKLAEAIGYYTKALQINPDFAEVHCFFGIALVKQGKIADAIKHFSEALRISPGYAFARTNLEKALQLQKQSQSNIQ